MPRHRVCILSEGDAHDFRVGIEYACSKRRHRHYTRAKTDYLVELGELRYIGKHKRVAMFTSGRTWMKVYTKTQYGAIGYCGMQYVRGGGGF